MRVARVTAWGVANVARRVVAEEKVERSTERE
jgi:hypothetical protein